MKKHQLFHLLRLILFLSISFGACFFWSRTNGQTSTQPIEKLKIHPAQAQWLQPGAEIEGGRVEAGLGFIAIAPVEGKVYAPFNGETKLGEAGCINFSAGDIPNQKFRLCGIQNPKIQRLQKGDEIGTSNLLFLCTLNMAKDKSWHAVEPSTTVVESFLSQKK